MHNTALTYNVREEENNLVDGSPVKKRAPKVSTMKRLFEYTLKHKILLFLANVSLIITSIGTIALPYLAGQIVDLISKDKNRDRLNTIAAQFTIVFIIVALFSFVRGATYNLLGEKVVLEIRNQLFSSLLAKDIEFYDRNRSGELISRITSDVSLVQTACSDTISVLIRNILQFIGSIILLWIISWKLTLVFLTVTPIFLGCRANIAQLFLRFYKRYTKEYQDKLALSTQVATESLQNIRIVKSFSTELEESKQFLQSTTLAYTVGKKRAILIGLFSCIGMLLGNIAIMCVLWYGGVLVLDGELSVGDLSSFVLYTMTLAVSVLAVSGMMNILLTASAVAEKIFELMDEEAKIKSGSFRPIQQLQGSITFVDVNFVYPSKQSVPVLQQMNLEIKQGEVIAFVGQSGSGKSTIVSLVERFYDVTSGSIKIDDKDLKTYDLKYLHQQIGFVAQEPTLFSGTLRENIVYGVKECSEDDIIKSLKSAHAYEFVSNKDYFPDGLETIVGERGVKLSGGQKQRIAIARALIKNPKILIFDEATSALDAESEFQVQQAIDELMKSGAKTILIIAHRLSTIINCQKIAVLERGRIVEYGSHNQLLELNGFYKALIERQLSSFENKVDITIDQ